MGRHNDAERLLGGGSAFTALSTRIVSELNRFKSEVGQGHAARAHHAPTRARRAA